MRGGQPPVVRKGNLQVGDVVGTREVGGRGKPGKLHALRVEVMDFAKAGGDLFHAVVIQQPRSQRQRKVVGVFLAVGTGEAIGGEQLPEIERQRRGVE